MKRLALYTFSAVLMLAGEPAVGATNRPAPALPGPEFGRPTILLADGERLDLDLAAARRAGRLFSLAEFVGDREVVAVGLRARARGDRAFVGVGLVQPAETFQGVPNGTDP